MYGVKRSRQGDSFFKKWTAQLYYKALRFMGVEVPFNHADYRLLSRKALIALSRFKETEIFLRGIIPLLGLRSSFVHYDIKKRLGGKSKYTLRKMLKLAIVGVTSFTAAPLRFVTITGFIMFLFSLAAIIYVSIAQMLGKTVKGWSSLMASLYLLAGTQLLAIGLVGEYIVRIYLEVKRRPRYLICDRRGFKNGGF